LVDSMSALELETETELTAEIDDLSSYLRGIPADLRASGAFTPYEARLQQLRENLLALRLRRTLERYEHVLRRHTSTPVQERTADELHQWLRQAERWHEDAAHGYLRTAAVLNGLVVAFGTAAGVGAFVATGVVSAPFACLAVLAGAFQLLYRPAEKSRSQQEIADRLEMLRVEIENIAASRSSTPREVTAHRMERALQLLDDTNIN
jgi:ABC-type transport system involved in cytochrome bd biosynthesis fused ATPase/permease subunit